MRKGMKIQNVEITNSHEITAYDTEGCRVKITRHQRMLFANYKNPSFLQDVKSEFSSDILASDFYILKDGETVYVRN